jgi:hypothetical protein
MPPIRSESRQKGQIPCAEKRPSDHSLTQLEEDSLTEWILSVDMRGAGPRPTTIKKMANILMAARGSNLPPTFGKNWSSTFTERRDELQSRFSRRFDYQRVLNGDPKTLPAWLTILQSVSDENGIQAEDICDFDKTGFAKGSH